jgi:hypothetical protein
VRVRLLACAALLLALVAWLAAPSRVASGPQPRERTARPALPRPAPLPDDPAPKLPRDPFRYAEASPQALPPVVAVAPRADGPAAPASEGVWLVGFVRRGEKLRAVLSLGGSVYVAGPGESVEGYRVLSVDVDQGVRLVGPKGELLLEP